MHKKVLNQVINIKEYICEKEYKEINELQETIISKDKVNLKLELDFKFNMHKNSEVPMKRINEFLYYVDDTLVAYLGISCFGRNVAEINGMTHPDWRRRGVFKKLFELAMNECRRRSFNKILLLADGKSESGIEFVKAVGAGYDFSEYRMESANNDSVEDKYPINLRKAEECDKKQIAKLNLIYFDNDQESNEGLDCDEIVEETEKFEEDDEFFIANAYMIELNNQAIGKIYIEYNDNSAFISGFGLLPEHRGKGYGKAALKEALKLTNENNINQVGLDVSAKNSRALNLYKSCGFEEKSVMNYYRYDTRL